MQSFSALGLPESIATALTGLGFAAPTAIQAEAIPSLLAGRDLFMESETGTGKTFAYLAPILTRISEDSAKSERGKGPLALVAAPTQELAVQIGREAEKLARAAGIEAGVAVILGGSPLARQEAALHKGPSLVVGTLGRLADLASVKVLKTGRLRFLVLDEADRLFAKETEELTSKLLDAVPRNVVRILASATLPERTKRLAAPWLREPAHAKGAAPTVLSKDIEHWCFYCDSRKRLDFLRRFEASLRPARCLVFHSNAARLGAALETLDSLGIEVEAISARLDKEARHVALDRFSRGEVRWLLTSDLGARGLDIPAVSHIISLDLPEEPTVYVHRAGRTGRAGAKGISIILADGFELDRAAKLARRGDFVFRTKVLREGKVFEPEPEEFFALAEAAEAQRRESRAKRAAEGREGGLPPRRPASKAPPRRSGIRFPNYEEDRNRRPPVTPEGRSGPQDWSPDKTPARDREAGEGSGRSPATPRGSPREGRSAPREPGRTQRGDAGRPPRDKGPDPRPGGKSRQ